VAGETAQSAGTLYARYLACFDSEHYWVRNYFSIERINLLQSFSSKRIV
jgi:hypothetical protein